jgi:aminoglycoside phosphotransferase
MEARELVTKLHPDALVRELSSGANKVFRVIEGEQSTIVKVYPVASRERRERHALEALADLPTVPKIIEHGTHDEMAWLQMNDAGHWNLANLPKNLDTMEAAGAALRGIHDSNADITNLAAGIDADYVLSHYRSTIERLGRYRRRFGMDQAVLDRALLLEPPIATDPVPAHTKPTLSKFVIDESGAITIVDWEWATKAPKQWDQSLATWRIAARIGEDAAAAFRKGYGADMPESSYRPWVAYHPAMMMLEAAELREGKLGDLSYLVDDLTEAVVGT